MGSITKRQTRDRSKINIDDALEIKYWMHNLGISREQLQGVIDKVGNSAAAVRKELSRP